MRQIAIILFLFLSLLTSAQNEDTSFEQIKESASLANQNILIVFSGSDWCKPCIKLKKRILDTSLFQNATENFQFVYADFPYKKSNALTPELVKRNETLAEQFNPNGAFPYAVLVDTQGELVTEIETSSSITPAEFILQIEKHNTHENTK